MINLWVVSCEDPFLQVLGLRQVGHVEFKVPKGTSDLI